jgi:DNA-binding transcriptional ArsR family regulator
METETKIFLLLAIWPNSGRIIPMMDEKTQAGVLTRAKIFKALAHPSRLFILEQLAEGERCVCDLTDMIGADISTISKHLSVLKSAGVIHAEKRGLQVFYRLKMPCILRFFECVGEVVQANAKEQWDIVKISERQAAKGRRARD